MTKAAARNFYVAIFDSDTNGVRLGRDESTLRVTGANPAPYRTPHNQVGTNAISDTGKLHNAVKPNASGHIQVVTAEPQTFPIPLATDMRC